MRRESLCRMKMEVKWNIKCGTPSDKSWLLPFGVGLMRYGLKPGARVLCLGAASGTTVSHVSDIVGATGVVYVVEFSHHCGRDFVAKERTNVIPIIENA
ncbi:hypothetical protein BT93_H2013 [Corymbia citriodora subsp. variegata]|nr:hypothetical protein BT93_H2013 [Corymbia citriodora subsp. variegata]